VHEERQETQELLNAPGRKFHKGQRPKRRNRKEILGYNKEKSGGKKKEKAVGWEKKKGEKRIYAKRMNGSSKLAT